MMDESLLFHDTSLWTMTSLLQYPCSFTRFSTLALCKVLTYAVTTKDCALCKMTVLDDESSETQHKGYSLRSKSQSIEFWFYSFIHNKLWLLIFLFLDKPVKMVPLLIKLFKLVIHELKNQLDSNEALDESFIDVKKFWFEI